MTCVKILTRQSLLCLRRTISRVTRDEEAAKLSEDLAGAAMQAGESVEIGQCISMENSAPDAPVPCHILQVESRAYNLEAAHTSPVLTHSDGSNLNLPVGERVVDALFYQPIGKTGLRYELWNSKWFKHGQFKKDFVVWEGCPLVKVRRIAPCMLCHAFYARDVNAL